MSEKNNTKVLINGTVYTLSGQESEEYIQKVALYINHKMDELKQSDNGQQLNTRLLNVLLSLNIADELFKERNRIEALKEHYLSHDERVQSLNDQISNLELEKQQLQVKIKGLEEEVLNYKKELDEYIQIFDDTNV